MNQQGITDPQMLSNPRMIIPQQSEIIYEIYIQAKNAIAEDFLIWLDTVLIKEMLSYEGFRAAKLHTLINDDSKNRTKKYTCYSVQFLVDSVDLLNNYLTNYGDKLRLDAAAIYGKQFTEERRILSFQKFYTFDSSFNPNLNPNVSGALASSAILTTEPIANPQTTPGAQEKTGIIADIKSFFGFNRKREGNLLVDNSNVASLAPNPLLAKNVSNEPVMAQSAAQMQANPNVVNRDKNLFFGKDDKDLNPIPSSSDNNNLNNNNNDPNLMPISNLLTNEPYRQNAINVNNENLINSNNANANLPSSRRNAEDLTFSNREPIETPNKIKEESNLASDFQNKNIIATNEIKKENATITSSNISNIPVIGFSEDFNKNKFKDYDYNKRHYGEKDFSHDKDYTYSKGFIESVQSGDKDFPRKDVNRDLNYDFPKNDYNKETYVGAYNKDLMKDYDYEKFKGKKKENVIVEQTTEIKDVNDNQKYLSKDVYVGTMDKDKLENIGKDFKKEIFSSPSNTDYTVAYDLEEKENVNFANRNLLDKDRFGSGLGKDDYGHKDVYKNSSEKQHVSGKGKNEGRIDDVI